MADELLRAAQLARPAPLRYAVSPDGRKYELGLPPPGLESSGH